MISSKVLFTIALSLILVACNKPVAKTTPESTTQPTPTQAESMTGEDHGADDDHTEDESDSIQNEATQASEVSDATMYTMETGMFYFSVKEIQAKPGETITVKLENKEGLHDFVIDELDVQSGQVKAAGDTIDVTFTVPMDAAGKEFEYYCSIGQHRANGMVGKLVVSE